ncbi:MAG: metallothionein [Acidobacteria bacterium]|nr:MAG: metallothionein [Acidobacteriota bacterium]
MSCAHPGCKCPEGTVQRSGKSFCSEHCADASTAGGRTPSSKGGCGCGHPACR